MKKGAIRKHFRENFVGYLMVLPLLAGILVFSYYPPISGLRLAFFDKRSNTQEVFVGLDNFQRLFQDELFLKSIPTMFKIMIPRLIIGVVVPLVMAELIFGVMSKRAQSVYRILILLPIVAPGIVNTLIWSNILDASSNGILNGVLHAFGMDPNTNINWLGDYDWVIFSIVFMGFPWVGGTSVLIYMSGLMGIPTEVIEASRLDGAGPILRIFTIDLPHILGQIKYFVVFGAIGGFQDYGTQLVLTHGGPGDATYVPAYYLFNVIQMDDDLGYASAIGVLLFVTIALTAGILMVLFKTDRTE